MNAAVKAQIEFALNMAAQADRTITPERIALAIQALKGELTRPDEHDGKDIPDRSQTALITQADTAKRLKVSRTTVWRMCREGILTSVTVRGAKRVKLASVLDYLAGNRPPTDKTAEALESARAKANAASGKPGKQRKAS